MRPYSFYFLVFFIDKKPKESRLKGSTCPNKKRGEIDKYIISLSGDSRNFWCILCIISNKFLWTTI